MNQQEYLPQWRALLLARAMLGDKAKLWRRGGSCCVGVVTRRIGPGRTEAALLGRGADWREALAAAKPRAPAGLFGPGGNPEPG